ncbi:bifunctional Ribosomal protein S6 superfamily/Translation elongation factor EF1B-ribosomal protein S6/Ribosomal protein S6 [Babesia duncani]|uniref:Bifunctional Ribosomal protein S6 superfamily/Translation elongation factor EF1B-ribosomal protein S6/Ribosomal protein S6 n=1 Tax=Babesia duncani TaxID=323732 RepID=A0AAD9UMT3_9APIC|nr:bifunctional Ribosomal protein S6 superfamily/Translation elongation factor EF1B-ribosomal protein S6/Ribosomal protein S6 [Babesia duncani]
MLLLQTSICSVLLFRLLLVSCISSRISSLSFISSSGIFDSRFFQASKTRVSGHFTRELYKTIKRRIIENTETPEKRKIRIDKEDRSKRDGLLYAPKTSYEIYIAVDNRPPEELKQRFRHILSKLKQIGAEHTNVYYCGLRRLVRPIKKKYEACFILLELAVYPSLIEIIRLKLLGEPHVLRVLVLRDIVQDKKRRVYRDNNLHVRHPYFNSDIYRPLMSRLIAAPPEGLNSNVQH